MVDSQIFHQRTRNAEGVHLDGRIVRVRCRRAFRISGVIFALVVTYISALFYPLRVLERSYGDVMRYFAYAEQAISLLRIPTRG